MKRCTFTYKIADIQKEVEKRTSYLGKMRSTKEEPHLLDRLALTGGESFLFEQYLHEAAGRTYDWIQAFGKNVKYSFELIKTANKDVYEYYGMKVMVDDKLQYPTTLEIPITSYQIINTSIVVVLNDAKETTFFRSEENDILLENESYNQSKDIYVYCFISQNGMKLYSLSLEQQKEDFVYDETAISEALNIVSGASRVQYLINHATEHKIIDISKNNIDVQHSKVSFLLGKASKITYKLKLYCRTNIPDTPIYDDIILENVSSITNDTEYTSDIFNFTNTDTVFGQTVIDDVLGLELEIIDIQAQNIQQLFRGDYISYHKYDDTFEYYIVESDCIETDMLNHTRQLECDMNNSVVYRLDIPEWVNENMVYGTKNKLWETIVNYIIGLWFEFVLSDEAQTFIDKAENHGWEAQMALNAEKKILNRQYKTF